MHALEYASLIHSVFYSFRWYRNTIHSMNKSLLRIAFLMACLLPLPAAQQRDPLAYIEILESAERVRRLQVDRVIDSLQIVEGSVVADLGAGSGLFTRKLADRVGDNGAVYAVDIDSALLAHIEKVNRESGVRNVQTILAAESDPKIPEPVDLVLMCDTLHHLSDRPSYLTNLKQYVKPGGRVAVIDFEKNWPGGHEEMKYTLAELRNWMAQAGYREVKQYQFLEDNFFVIWEVDGGW